MAKLTLSIVIISFNTARITKDCLDSVIKSVDFSRLPYEIIVIDNASSDASVAMLKAYAKSVKIPFTLILNKENVGFGRANNQGVAKAQGEHILLLNSDIIVLDDAIERLVDYYEEHKREVQFLGGKLLNKDMSPQPSAAPFYTLPVVFGALFLRGDYWGLTRYSPTKARKVDWVSGACILTKKECYDRIGGFDPGIFMYFDEVDLLYRARRAGMHTYFLPDARFIHLGSASSGGKKTYPVIKVFGGFIYFYRKHHSRSALFLLRILLQLKAGIALALGRLTGNSYLTETYEQAYRMAKTT